MSTNLEVTGSIPGTSKILKKRVPSSLGRRTGLRVFREVADLITIIDINRLEHIAIVIIPSFCLCQSVEHV